MMSAVDQDVETSCKSFMVEMMVTKGQNGKGEHFKVIIWLNYGSEGAGGLIGLEAVFVMKDVCIMKYHCTLAIFQHLLKIEKRLS